MSGLNKEELLDRLRLIRKNLCTYTHDPCDCKFNQHHGCPEVYEAIALIEKLTDKQFNVLRKKAKIKIFELDKKDELDKKFRIKRIRKRKKKLSFHDWALESIQKQALKDIQREEDEKIFGTIDKMIVDLESGDI